MKWLKIGLLTALLLLLIPLPLTASTTAEITITATGYVVEAPGAFTITYISDYEIALSWTMGSDAVATMIRGAIDYEPFDRNDGFLVYNGTGESCTAKINLAGDNRYFFRAWSLGTGGLWEEEGTSAWTEGFGMTFIGLIMLGAFLMVAGFWRKTQAILWVAALTWVGFAFWQRSITPTWGTWDLHEIMFFVGFLMMVVCMTEAVMLHRGEQPEPVSRVKLSPSDENAARYRAMMQNVRDKANRYRRR